MIVPQQPQNIVVYLLFIVMASAISAYVTYYVNERIKKLENQK